jgi:hypothetical protein
MEFNALDLQKVKHATSSISIAKRVQSIAKQSIEENPMFTV